MPGDPGYDEARSHYNAMIDVRPAVIAQCSGADDVVRALRFGRDASLEIGVGGYILGGGDGWFARKLGLACENLVSVQLVTAA